MFPFLVAVINKIILLHFLPPRQDNYHWIQPVGIFVSVVEFDGDYGMGLSVL